MQISTEILESKQNCKTEKRYNDFLNKNTLGSGLCRIQIKVLLGTGDVDDEPVKSVSVVDVDHDQGVQGIAGIVNRITEKIEYFKL